MSRSSAKYSAKQNDAIGKYEIKKLSFLRRLLIEGLDAVPSGHNMMALMESDITDARKILRTQKKNGKRVSFFAFIIKSIAIALAEYKELNSIRSENRIVEFRDIDVNIPIELDSQGEKFAHQIVIRKASEKSVEEIYNEINMAKKHHQLLGNAGREDKWILNIMKKLLILPKFIRTLILKSFVNNPFTVKKMSGTTFVTSVSMLAPGYAIPYLGTPRAVSFALGGVFKKPAVVNKKIVTREFLSMTLIFNHDLVDGAPAARFTNRLKKIIESACVLVIKK